MDEQNKLEQCSWEQWVEMLTQMEPQEQLTTLLQKVQEQMQEIQKLSSEKSEMLQLLQQQESQIQQQAEQIEKLNASDQELQKAMELQASYQKKVEKLTQKVEELNIREETLNQKESSLKEKDNPSIPIEATPVIEDSKPKKVDKKKDASKLLCVISVICMVIAAFLIIKILPFDAWIKGLADSSIVGVEEHLLQVCIYYSVYYGIYAAIGGIALFIIYEFIKGDKSNGK